MGGSCCKEDFRFKRLVDDVYPASPDGDANRDSLGKLAAYVHHNPERIPRVCRKVWKISNLAIEKKQVKRVAVGVEIHRELLLTAKDLQYYIAPTVDAALQLLQREEPEHRVAAADLIAVLTYRYTQDFSNDAVSRTLLSGRAPDLITALEDLASEGLGTLRVDALHCRYAAMVACGNLVTAVRSGDRCLSLVDAALQSLHAAVQSSTEHAVVPVQPAKLTRRSKKKEAAVAFVRNVIEEADADVTTPVCDVALPTDPNRKDRSIRTASLRAIAAVATTSSAAALPGLLGHTFDAVGKLNDGWSTPMCALSVARGLAVALQTRRQLGFVVCQELLSRVPSCGDPARLRALLSCAEACIAVVPMTAARPLQLFNVPFRLAASKYAATSSPVDQHDSSHDQNTTSFPSAALAAASTSVEEEAEDPHHRTARARDHTFEDTGDIADATRRLLVLCLSRAAEVRNTNAVQRMLRSLSQRTRSLSSSAPGGSSSPHGVDASLGTVGAGAGAQGGDSAAAAAHALSVLASESVASATAHLTAVERMEAGVVPALTSILMRPASVALYAAASRALREHLTFAGAEVEPTLAPFELVAVQQWADTVVLRTCSSESARAAADVLTAVIARQRWNAALWTVEWAFKSLSTLDGVVAASAISQRAAAWVHVILAVLRALGLVLSSSSLAQHAEHVAARRQFQRTHCAGFAARFRAISEGPTASAGIIMASTDAVDRGQELSDTYGISSSQHASSQQELAEMMGADVDVEVDENQNSMNFDPDLDSPSAASGGAPSLRQTSDAEVSAAGESQDGAPRRQLSNTADDHVETDLAVDAGATAVTTSGQERPPQYPHGRLPTPLLARSSQGQEFHAGGGAVTAPLRTRSNGAPNGSATVGLGACPQRDIVASALLAVDDAVEALLDVVNPSTEDLVAAGLDPQAVASQMHTAPQIAAELRGELPTDAASLHTPIASAGGAGASRFDSGGGSFSLGPRSGSGPLGLSGSSNGAFPIAGGNVVAEGAPDTAVAVPSFRAALSAASAGPPLELCVGVEAAGLIAAKQAEQLASASPRSPAAADAVHAPVLPATLMRAAAQVPAPVAEDTLAEALRAISEAMRDDVRE